MLEMKGMAVMNSLEAFLILQESPTVLFSFIYLRKIL